jgi:Fur family transcriptional regulator, iron response regulator
MARSKSEVLRGWYAVISPTAKPTKNFSRLLRRAALRPTRQRAELARLLFSGDRHVTAEVLHSEASAQGSRISLATVYNTLKQFRDAGLLRELAIDGSRTYFDTNTSNHNHFYIEAEHDIFDIPKPLIRAEDLPTPPEGYEIAHVDVVIRLVRKTAPRENS